MKAVLRALAIFAFVATTGALDNYHKVWIGPPGRTDVDMTHGRSVNPNFVMHFEIEIKDGAVILHSQNQPVDGNVLEMDLGDGRRHLFRPSLIGIKEDNFLHEAAKRNVLEAGLRATRPAYLNFKYLLGTPCRYMLRIVVLFESDTASPFRLEIPVAAKSAEKVLTPQHLLDLDVSTSPIYTINRTKFNDFIKEKQVPFDWLDELLSHGRYESDTPFRIEGWEDEVETFITRIVLIEDLDMLRVFGLF